MQTTDRMTVNEVRNEVHAYLKKHGLFDKGWRFKLSRGKRAIGLCHYGKREISISKYHIELNSSDEVKATIIHEVAHALTPGARHGPEWKQKTLELGGVPTRTANVKNRVPHKYEVVCTNCNMVVQKRHRNINPIRLMSRFHKRCGREAIGMLKVRYVSD